jgi:hypothetical protein
MSSLFILCFNKHGLPLLKCSDQECIADFQLQKDIRLNHPCTCSLEFQNVMQIITDRKTLYCHWQIWVKEIDQTLRIFLFHEDMCVKNTARNIFCKHIVTVITGSYGSEFCITHKCNNINNDIVSKHDAPEKLFQEQNARTFCCARHKELCSEIQGKSCHALTVKKQSLHLTLSTNLSNSFKSI